MRQFIIFFIFASMAFGTVLAQDTIRISHSFVGEGIDKSEVDTLDYDNYLDLRIQQITFDRLLGENMPEEIDINQYIVSEGVVDGNAVVSAFYDYYSEREPQVREVEASEEHLGQVIQNYVINQKDTINDQVLLMLEDVFGKVSYLGDDVFGLNLYYLHPKDGLKCLEILDFDSYTDGQMIIEAATGLYKVAVVMGLIEIYKEDNLLMIASFVKGSEGIETKFYEGTNIDICVKNLIVGE